MISTLELQHARILIVDDHALNVALLVSLLTSAGYQRVTSTTDARQVESLHRRNRYDLILLDMNMPYLNGFEVLDALKQIDDDDYLPVLVVSAEVDHKLRALASGAQDFVAKPYNYVEMLSRVRNLLEVRLLYQGKRACALHMARCDDLTGLPNRSLFKASLAQALQLHGAQTNAVLVLDIDGFRRVNDSFGQQAGDEILRQCAQRLQACVTDGSLVGRVGNDEFALLLSALPGEHEALRVAERVRATLAAPFTLDGAGLTLGASIGMALAPRDGNDAQTLIRHADTAQNMAKQAGGNRLCVFTETMNADARRRFETENALRTACANGEFELYYQPKARLSTGRIAGAEALLRWNRPGHGMVAPADFIPVLEETGLIVEVGTWVIEQACRQIAAWQHGAAGPTGIAVNVASRQFTDSNLVAIVASAIAASGIDARLLGLEVTESALMSDTERTAATLEQLRTLGVRVAIDDFGTGYSSLAYLKRFPVDTLKIDVAFIRDVATNPDDAALVDAIIAMAHSLDLEVVAEGVETPAQLAFLGRHRCDQIQGYHFSRPLPAAHYGQLLRTDPRLRLPGGVSAAPARTLLLVDNEPGTLAALQRLLREDGYHILAAANADAAFTLLAQHHVHVILCEQSMDEMSGTEFFGRVKDMYPDTLRILLSGSTDLTSIAETFHRGALYRFYTKPWDNAVLRENVGAAFRHYWQLHGIAAPVGTAVPDLALA